MTKDNKIEIYTLSKKIDKIDIDDLNGDEEVVVDLSNVEKEQEYLEKKELITPIREQEQFKKIQIMKEAEKLKSETEDTEENQSIIELLNEKINEGKRAIEYLLKAYKPCAINCAKAWLHSDRINQTNDWNQIIDMAIFNAIMDYDLEKGTQFTTFLTTIVRRDCKENKHISSLVSVNASAMHKARMLKKAEEEVVANGGSIDDDYAVAAAMGRDISNPRKLAAFRQMRMDMQNVSPQGMSMEAQVDVGSRTLGESIASNSLSGEEVLILRDYEKRMRDFCSKLPDDYISVIKAITTQNGQLNKISNSDKILERLSGNETFKNLLKEGLALQQKGIHSTFFYD